MTITSAMFALLVLALVPAALVGWYVIIRALLQPYLRHHEHRMRVEGYREMIERPCWRPEIVQSKRRDGAEIVTLHDDGPRAA